MKKITIECECGCINEIDGESLKFIIGVFDTTPCSCGCCHGESFKVTFGQCPKCGKSFQLDTP